MATPKFTTDQIRLQLRSFVNELAQDQLSGRLVIKTSPEGISFELFEYTDAKPEPPAERQINS